MTLNGTGCPTLQTQTRPQHAGPDLVINMDIGDSWSMLSGWFRASSTRPTLSRARHCRIIIASHRQNSPEFPSSDLERAGDTDGLMAYKAASLWLLKVLMLLSSASAIHRSQFPPPPDFLFGTSTSAYQVHPDLLFFFRHLVAVTVAADCNRTQPAVFKHTIQLRPCLGDPACNTVHRIIMLSATSWFLLC
jgi:hypothetical protein